jgi:hypothetical protein
MLPAILNVNDRFDRLDRRQAKNVIFAWRGDF